MAKGRAFVGIDLGGTNMQIGVVDADGRVVGRSRQKTKAEQGEDRILERIIGGIETACEQARMRPQDVGGIGIGAPGMLDPKTGSVVRAVNLRWNDVPLAKELHGRFGVPVLCDNDVNVAVYGEWRMGAGKGSRYLLGVWLGTGVGGGLILDGELYEGEMFSAGEVGHTVLLPGSPMGRRSLEDNCSRSAVVDRLVHLIQGNHASSLEPLVHDENRRSGLRSREVAEAYAKGDALTVRVVDEAAELLGVGVANVCTTLSIGRVVLGGGLSEALGKPLSERVQAVARRHVFMPDPTRLVVTPSKLEDDAGLLGASLLVRRAVEEGGKGLENGGAWEHVRRQIEGGFERGAAKSRKKTGRVGGADVPQDAGRKGVVKKPRKVKR